MPTVLNPFEGEEVTKRAPEYKKERQPVGVYLPHRALFLRFGPLEKSLQGGQHRGNLSHKHITGGISLICKSKICWKDETLNRVKSDLVSLWKLFLKLSGNYSRLGEGGKRSE